MQDQRADIGARRLIGSLRFERPFAAGFSGVSPRP